MSVADGSCKRIPSRQQRMTERKYLTRLNYTEHELQQGGFPNLAETCVTD